MIIKGVNIIIVNNKNQLLLQLRDNKKTIPYPNTWVILGGEVEPKETPEQALVREIKEETELELKNFKLFKIYNWEDFEQHVFFTKLNLEVKNVKLHEGQKIKYFPKSEIEKLKLGFHIQDVLNDFFNSTFSSEN